MKVVQYKYNTVIMAAGAIFEHIALEDVDKYSINVIQQSEQLNNGQKFRRKFNYFEQKRKEKK